MLVLNECFRSYKQIIKFKQDLNFHFFKGKLIEDFTFWKYIGEGFGKGECNLKNGWLTKNGCEILHLRFETPVSKYPSASGDQGPFK